MIAHSAQVDGRFTPMATFQNSRYIHRRRASIEISTLHFHLRQGDEAETKALFERCRTENMATSETFWRIRAGAAEHQQARGPGSQPLPLDMQARPFRPSIKLSRSGALSSRSRTDHRLPNIHENAIVARIQLGLFLPDVWIPIPLNLRRNRSRRPKEASVP